ncbi:MAG: hypothetical protein JW768_09920 [Chitinispirillaceae bacterium]|nr:hypothetical protein [Chitinispirillaceae bacterium]
MPTRTFLSVFCILTGAGWLGCVKEPPPPCSMSDLLSFFSGPTDSVPAVLRSCSLDTAAFRKALDSLRIASPAGDRKTVLTDVDGIPYTLGYRTPQHIRQDTLYPLIIYLHGGIGTERNDKGDSAFLMLEALADTFRLFCASPSANRNAPWWSNAGLTRILQSLRYMTLHYPIHPDKVFCAGVSDGATGCYAAANTINGPFAGFFAISGFGGMLPNLGMRLVPKNLMQRPIYNVNAELDHLYPAEYVRRFVQDLKHLGVVITDTIYPKEKHGFEYRDKEMGALAQRIRSWSRPRSTAVMWTFVPGVPNVPPNLIDWETTSEDAFVRLYWRNDTMTVRSQGLASFVVSLPRSSGIERATCRFPAKQKLLRTVYPEKDPSPQELKHMAHHCFPQPSGAYFFRITLP